MTNPRFHHRVLFSCVLALALLADLSAQSLSPRSSPAPVLAPYAEQPFENFETPQVKPIATATVGSVECLLVCNTPDDSVEVWEAAFPHRFIARVPTGLGPVTVRWNASLGRLFTCNFDGDSVTIARLEPDPSPAPGRVPVRAVLERTTWVGDEPADLTFIANDTRCSITLNGSSSITTRFTADLTPVGSDLILIAPNPHDPLLLAVKAPRQVEALPDGRVFVLNFMGDVDDTSLAPKYRYDLDLWVLDPQATATLSPLGGLGSTNHAFAISSDASRMYVVGTLARNQAVGVAAARQQPTGFVESRVWVIDLTPGLPPVVRAEAPAGVIPSPSQPSLDLNRDYAVTATVGAVPFADALAQPTDIVLLEDGAGQLEKMFVTAYHSDKVAVLEPDTSRAGGWRIGRISIPLGWTAAAGYTTTGPRGLVLAPNVQDPATPGQSGLLYVMNRLNNSVTVINPHTETVRGTIKLRNDPTPKVIRHGRQFLYGAKHSGTGFVSCASCHVDGRTDGLNWDLGNNDPVQPPIAFWFHDDDGLTTTSFPAQKGPKATQTLQGLVNYEVNPEMQVLFTNAPYHWRGDKAEFTDFNEAFHNLHGMPNVGTPSEPRGISPADMIAFQAFVRTIRHPGNPEQPLERVVEGTLGTDPNDVTSATGTKLGLLLFHNVPSVLTRSCVDCHALPEGSSNTATLAFPQVPTITGGAPVFHPMETPALRNLVPREMFLHAFLNPVPGAIVSSSGLLNAGNHVSINIFVDVFRSTMPGPTQAELTGQIESVVEFVRTFDTGTSSLAGFPFTVEPTAHVATTAAFNLFEGQVEEGNVGLAVHTRSGGVERGYWFDVTLSPSGYREEGGSAVISRATLRAMATGPDDVVILQCTPLRQERRVASLSGRRTLLRDPANPPANVTLEAMAPPTPWVDVAGFTGNISPSPPGNSSQWSLRTLQSSVIGTGVGIPVPRHEPPRRFRVVGDDIRPGAKLVLGMASRLPGALPVRPIILDLVPTKYTSGGRRVWESVQEAAPMVTLALLNGGIFAPDVVRVILRTTVTPVLDPANWNRYLVTVVNEDGSAAVNPTWQVLRVQDSR